MKTWMIVAIIFGLLIMLVGGMALVNAISNNSDTPETTQVTQSTGSPTCTGCNGGNAGECNTNSNCGLAACRGVSGAGSCGCGRR